MLDHLSNRELIEIPQLITTKHQQTKKITICCKLYRWRSKISLVLTILVKLVYVKAMCHMDADVMRVVGWSRSDSETLKDIIFGAVGVMADCWDNASVKQHFEPGAGWSVFNSTAFL